MTLKATDFPIAFRAADEASLKGQATYKHLFVLDLLLVVTAPALASLGPLMWPQHSGRFAFAAAVALAISIVLKLINRASRPDRTWFDGRAVAETVKSEAWRYMMRLKPFDDEATADREFARIIIETVKARPALSHDAAAQDTPGEQITQRMRSVRQGSVQERLHLYWSERLEDQARWYGKNAKASQDAAGKWFWAAVACQVLGAGVAMWRLQDGDVPFSLVGLMTSAAAAFTAFAQIGRYDELQKTYGLAHQELTAIMGHATNVTDQDGLGEVVEAGELAISREHTMWVAKRTDPLPLPRQA